jgi:hypothetical protein
MKAEPVIQDERTKAVANEGSRLGFNILSFGVLLDLTLRAFFYRESNWDLFGLIIVSSLAALLYQAMHKALPPRFLRGVILLGAGSALVAILIVLILARSGWSG